MKQISQKDFEKIVQDIIDGKTTRTKLLTELKIDRTTLNNRIQELVVYNPSLYNEFIEKFPYRPREYSHIDYEALIIDILKKGYKRREWDDVYEIDSRTITRKIHVLEQQNPDLINLYREVSKYRKQQKQLPKELQEKVDLLEEKEIYICGICDKKREELLETETKYTEAVFSGMGATKASEVAGQKRVSKAIKTLNRIEIERQANNKKAEEEKGER